ncbi:DUF5076 domain-containing protein [Inquilinus limosus]|uniref:DUF5076 domain-containing protein n=1 Tax=Inquilinus limosus TaxID=171674 RepID=UPI0003F7C14D|nr:DUF5076 domain-containing protein [Inquilinus limosus]
MKELRIPDAAKRDPKSTEMLRVWIAEEGLHCALKFGLYEDTPWEEEKAWGTILADTARHVVRALDLHAPGQHPDALAKIRAKFLEELDDPTSPVRGDFVR